MTVVHFHSGNWYGGVEKLLIDLFEYRSLSPEVKPVFVLCHRGWLSTELEKRGAIVEVVSAPQMGKPWTLIPVWLQLGRILKKYQPDVIVSHEIENYALTWPVEQFFSIKSVLWIHSSGFRLRSPVYQKLESRIPDMAICASRHVREEVNRLWPELKTDYLYPPHAKPSIEIKKIGRKKDVTFIYVGRMVEYKGLADIIEALGKIRHLHFHFIVVGGPQKESEKNYQQKNIKRVKELGISSKVDFVGFKENAFDYMQSADVFVHPNKLPEPFGLVFLEALLAGIPIVATNIGGAKEILELQPRKMGDLVPPNDVEILASVLGKYIEDKNYRWQLSKNIKERFVNICDPEKSMKRLATLLQSV